MTPSEKDLWILRRDMLRSLNLDAICAEVNKRRLAWMITQAACPLPEQKRKWTRFLADYESGRGVRLPSDECAGPARMRRVLLLLHRLIAARNGITVSIDQLAKESGETRQTLRRAVRDCRRAGLIDEPYAGNPQHQSGSGANYYELPWLVIEQLAANPGIQLSIQVCDDVPGVNEEDRSGRPSGRNDGCGPPPTVGGGLPIMGGPPSHSGDPPLPQWEAPPPTAPPILLVRTARGGARAHTRPLPLFSENITNPPPSSVEGTGEEEERIFSLPEWKQVERRLKRYPVAMVRRAQFGALKNGWRADQVLKLLDQCEAATIDGIRAYGGGVLVTHLELCDAGLPMRAKPATEYLKARERRAGREQAVLQTAMAHREADQRQRLAVRNTELEERYGPRLDAMSHQAVVDLARAALPQLAFQWFRKNGSVVTAFQRSDFLRALERRDREGGL